MNKQNSKKLSREIHGYSEEMPILDEYAGLECKARTRLPVSLKRLNRLLALIFVMMVLALAVLPWQQFIPGIGRVTALNPLERSIVLEAPLPGRVDEVRVIEGQEVRKGDLLFRISDNDPQLVENLRSQLVDMQSQRAAYTNKLSRMNARVQRLEESVPRALEMAEASIESAEASLKAAELNFERIKALYMDSRGLASQRDFELATMNRDNKQADVLKARSSRLKTELDLNASLESARASADTAQADLNKLDKDIRDLQIKINQTATLKVYAPRDGTIYRLNATEGSFLKAGSSLATIVPDAEELVVELWVDGNDMPLIQERIMDEAGNVQTPGSTVRLQFEGWPAIQFVGWPSVAVGTFGGEVIFVDAMDDGKGRFRVLVAAKPDLRKDINGNPELIDWPTTPVMRQGVAAQGWILLERVPLWFEVWRQLNGFPPTLKEGKSFSVKKKSK